MVGKTKIRLALLFLYLFFCQFLYTGPKGGRTVGSFKHVPLLEDQPLVVRS